MCKRGSIVVANLAKSLVLVTRGCCQLPAETQTNCLVVVPREALPTFSSALAGHAPLIASCDLDLVVGTLPRLVVVTGEIAKKCSILKETKWTRVVICDWDRIIDTIVGKRTMQRGTVNAPWRSPTLFPCDVQIALALSESMTSQQGLLLSVRELSLLLGVQPLQLGCPVSAKELLCERALRIEDEGAKVRLCRYDVVDMELPTEEEKEDAKNCSGFTATLVTLLGTLSTAGRRNIGRLPSSMTLQDYFAEQSGELPLTAFADASFKEDEHGCAVCLSEQGANAVTCCGHWFCTRCISRTLNTGFKQCPVCRQPLLHQRDVVVHTKVSEGTSYLKNLASLLSGTGNLATGKRLIVCSFGSCLERTVRFLRDSGVNAVSWSGNAQQLLHNLDAFRADANGCMLHDPEFLSLRWIEELADVRHIMCLLPLNTEKHEVCCQLRTILHAAHRARLSFVTCGGNASLPSEKSDCGCGDCPFLVRG